MLSIITIGFLIYRWEVTIIQGMMDYLGYPYVIYYTLMHTYDNLTFGAYLPVKFRKY